MFENNEPSLFPFSLSDSSDDNHDDQDDRDDSDDLIKRYVPFFFWCKNAMAERDLLH